MGCPPVRKIIHSLKLVDYLCVQTDNPWYNYYIVRETNSICRAKQMFWALNVIIVLSTFFNICFGAQRDGSFAPFSKRLLYSILFVVVGLYVLSNNV